MTAPQLEEWIHKTVIQHLRARAVPGAVFFHVPNSGRFPVQYRAKLNALGLRPGVSDIICLHRGEAFALELKRDKGGRTSDHQRAFLDDWGVAGGVGYVAEGLDDALEFLKARGIIRGVE